MTCLNFEKQVHNREDDGVYIKCFLRGVITLEDCDECEGYTAGPESEADRYLLEWERKHR